MHRLHYWLWVSLSCSTIQVIWLQYLVTLLCIISLQTHCTVFGTLKDTMLLVDVITTINTRLLSMPYYCLRPYMVAVLLQVQCNVFEGADGEVALTAAGGLRQIPGLTEVFENAALVLFLLAFHLFLLTFIYLYKRNIYNYRMI